MQACFVAVDIYRERPLSHTQLTDTHPQQPQTQFPTVHVGRGFISEAWTQPHLALCVRRRLGCEIVYDQSQKPRQEAIRGHRASKECASCGCWGVFIFFLLFLWPPVRSYFSFLIFIFFFVGCLCFWLMQIGI